MCYYVRKNKRIPNFFPFSSYFQRFWEVRLVIFFGTSILLKKYEIFAIFFFLYQDQIPFLTPCSSAAYDLVFRNLNQFSRKLHMYVRTYVRKYVCKQYILCWFRFSEHCRTMRYYVRSPVVNKNIYTIPLIMYKCIVDIEKYY